MPFPAADPQKTIRATKSTPSRSSWFGFSRAKPSSDAADPQSQTVPAQPQASASGTSAPSSSSVSGPAVPPAEPPAPGPALTAPPVDVSSIPIEPVDLSPSPLRAAPIRSPPRDIPSSSSTSTATAKATPMGFSPQQYSPPTPSSPADNLRSATTSISSVDEEVPRLASTGLGLESSALTITPQHAVVEPQDANLKAAGRKPSVSSLNPSTSRFTLRLPLLGRPKIPLEQAVASAQAEDVRGSSGSGSGDVVKQGGEGNGMCSFFPSVVGPDVYACVLMVVACSL